MLFKKIISGAQTGADRAALDFAIEVGIPYGGWVPKGRKAEDGNVPEKYDQLQEMKTSSYPVRTEKNILESHGTLIISHGKLSGGSLRTKKVAEQHKRPVLHIDLTKVNHFLAASKIITWASAYGIEILNVAGSRASKDPQIYQDTLKLLKAFYHMATVNEGMPDPQRISPLLPRTIEEALGMLIEKMDLKAKTRLSRMTEDELIYLHPDLGAFIRNHFELAQGNLALMKSCRSEAGNQNLNADSASFLIIRKLWERLRATHSLRVVQNEKPE